VVIRKNDRATHRDNPLIAFQSIQQDLDLRGSRDRKQTVVGIRQTWAILPVESGFWTTQTPLGTGKLPKNSCMQ
jgi:hypothetical protein